MVFCVFDWKTNAPRIKKEEERKIDKEIEDFYSIPSIVVFKFILRGKFWKIVLPKKAILDAPPTYQQHAPYQN